MTNKIQKILEHSTTKNISLQKFQSWLENDSISFPFIPICIFDAPRLNNSIGTNNKYWILNQTNEDKLFNIEYNIECNIWHDVKIFIHIHDETKLYLICTYLNKKNIYKQNLVIMNSS
jgi:hypothetical protein|uniref:Uncharacterized protein n=1 Tax=Mimiviridae sp. ChoanoV1 TaxID=2596887 RepID=A0A5B8HWW4_9VIRU|nr:hypothetical protein 6_35 [Mimiviridae sp. ChoanoV1]